MQIKQYLISALLVLCSTVSVAETITSEADFQTGQERFQLLCLSCHSGAFPEAPTVAALKLYAPQRIVKALDSGIMSS